MISIIANRFNGGKVPILGETVVSGSLILAEVVSIIGIGVILALATRGVLPHYAYVAAPGGILLLSTTTDGLLALFIAYKKMTRKPLSLPEPIIKVVKNKFTQKELKGNFHPLPNEILLHILHQTSPSALVQLTQVNSLFYTWIHTEKFFYAFNNLCPLVVNQINKINKIKYPDSQAFVWSKFIKIMVNWDLELAKKMVVKLTLHPDLLAPAWLDIFQAEPSKENQKQFLGAVSSQIKYSSFELAPALAKAYTNIYKILPTQENFDQAQKFIQLYKQCRPEPIKLLELEAQLDANKAKQMLDEMHLNRYEFNEILFKIIKIEIKNNLKKFKKDISKLTLSEYQEVENDISKLTFPDYQICAWTKLYEITQEKQYLDNAKAAFAKLTEHFHIIDSWYQICKVEINQDNLEKLINYQDTFFYNYQRRIIKIAAKYNIDYAKNYLPDCSSNDQDMLKVYIVEEEAKANFDAAFKTTNSIHTPSNRAQALLAIIHILHHRSINNDDPKSYALS